MRAHHLIPLIPFFLASTTSALPAPSPRHQLALSDAAEGLHALEGLIEQGLEGLVHQFIGDGDVEKKKEGQFVVQDEVKYTVVTHDAFPDYRIRLVEPKLCDPSVKQISGYIDISPTRHLFFWMFESRTSPKTDPLVLWLNGGPGCSSSTGLLAELGPCSVAHGGKDTVVNPYSWNSNANIIFLDQPVNVGYSYSESDSVNTTPVAAEDVYAFLQLFLSHYGEYASLPFSIAAESYGGRYAPLIASTIHKHNAARGALQALSAQKGGRDEVKEIKLESILLGNGLTDPKAQLPKVYDYACHGPYKVFDPEGSECQSLQTKAQTCERLINTCYSTNSRFTCLPAALYCYGQLYGPFENLGLNPYDVRKKCDRQKDGDLCYKEMGWIETYLNQADVKKQLGVPDRLEFQSCNLDINRAFMGQGDSMHNSAEVIPELLEAGVRVLVYAGKADFMCNYIGNKAWVLALDSPFHTELNNQTDKPYYTLADGRKAGHFRSAGGSLKTAGNFTFLEIEEAGHMVPMDQPVAALDLFSRWVHNVPYLAAKPQE